MSQLNFKLLSYVLCLFTRHFQARYLNWSYYKDHKIAFSFWILAKSENSGRLLHIFNNDSVMLKGNYGSFLHQMMSCQYLARWIYVFMKIRIWAYWENTLWIYITVAYVCIRLSVVDFSICFILNSLSWRQHLYDDIERKLRSRTWTINPS